MNRPFPRTIWPPASRDPLQMEPLAPRLKDVNPQLSSPLYNGRIPPEIRNQIFDYALSECMRSGQYVPQVVFQPPPSVAVQHYCSGLLNETFPTLQAPVSLHFPYPPATVNGIYPINTYYTRPGYSGPKRVYAGLLLVCKRVYLETHHLPFRNKEHVFWHGNAPPSIKYNLESFYFSRFRADQLALMKRCHVFAEQVWLEGIFPETCSQPNMQHIESLKITIRHCDWWDWENNAALGINPQSGDPHVPSMLESWAAEERGEKLQWNPDGWGAAFAKLSALRELEMEMEVPEYKKAELDAIVAHATKWRFPMRDGLVLSAEGQQVRTEYWRAPKSRWTKKCPTCDGADTSKEDCKFCAEKAALVAEGKGPRMAVVTVRWRLAEQEPVWRFSVTLVP